MTFTNIEGAPEIRDPSASSLSVKKSWVLDSYPSEEVAAELYGKDVTPPLSPRSLKQFSERQAELEEHSISAFGELDSSSFYEWPRLSVASHFHGIIASTKRRKAHVKKRRAASLGNVDLPSEMMRSEAASTKSEPPKPEAVVEIEPSNSVETKESAANGINIKTVDDLKKFLLKAGKLSQEDYDDLAQQQLSPRPPSTTSISNRS